MKDLLVIGAGFGGLGAAITAAEMGKSVTLLERLGYAGGCASTFERRGHRFESGATLFSGFAPGQLFHRWIERHNLPVTFQPIDPLVTLRTDSFEIEVSRHREVFVDRMCELTGQPDAVRSYFDEQKKVSDALWSLFDDPSLLQLDFRAIATLTSRAHHFLPTLIGAKRTVADVMRRHRVWEIPQMRVFADAVCQITVQASASNALAAFGLPAMDYFFRGTGHIEGGVGALAGAMWNRLSELGVETKYYDEARGLKSDGSSWVTKTRKDEHRSKFVAANLQPSVLSDLTEQQMLAKRQKEIEQGWGAAMLYRVVTDGDHLPEKAYHLELVADPSEPFIEGNHVFCSVSARGEAVDPSTRTMTISTHIPPNAVRYDGEQAVEYYTGIADKMRQTLRKLAPEVMQNEVLEMTASPRTFARFVGRPHGFVGGIPKTAIRQLADIRPTQPRPGLFVVGDTVFPGQSTLATAIGGFLSAKAMFG